MSLKNRFIMARPALAALLSLGVWSCGGSAQEPPKSASEKPPASAGSTSPAPAQGEKTASGQGGIEVLLCDGKTTTVVPEGTPGTAIAGALMAQWLRKNPNSNWEAEEKERHKLVPAADNSKLVTPAPVLTGQAQTYGRVTEQDVALWKAESERLATAGSRVFHNADELGSTIAVSCDMCHPHAANTHPETYPKFQAQLGRVALLRDMINWCLEHPVRAKPMSADDPRMRAMEAYIYAQRKGKALDYGRH
ncbi:c-type cytochrome [Pendulispora albinea]|uniref:Cytochrome c domain-containing protein n=1 Tax=Pendulispora albinea TaxID=2741071 RepID=A0ABZ2M3X9_9BACT